MNSIALLSCTILTLAAIAGCSNDPVIQERMVIDKHIMTFAHGSDSTETVSITHTCTCPFYWTTNLTPPAAWLTVPANMGGDNASVPFTIHRELLTQDTSQTLVHIQSNSYGADSIQVIAIR